MSFIFFFPFLLSFLRKMGRVRWLTDLQVLQKPRRPLYIDDSGLYFGCYGAGALHLLLLWAEDKELVELCCE